MVRLRSLRLFAVGEPVALLPFYGVDSMFAFGLIIDFLMDSIKFDFG